MMYEEFREAGNARVNQFLQGEFTSMPEDIRVRIQAPFNATLPTYPEKAIELVEQASRMDLCATLRRGIGNDWVGFLLEFWEPSDPVFQERLAMSGLSLDEIGITTHNNAHLRMAARINPEEKI